MTQRSDDMASLLVELLMKDPELSHLIKATLKDPRQNYIIKEEEDITDL